MNKKLAIFSITDVKGGAELLLNNIFHHLKPDVDFYYLSNFESAKVNESNIYYLSNTKNILKGFLNLILIYKRLNNYKIIISSHLYVNSFLGFLKKIRLVNKNVKLVCRESTSIFLREKGFRLIKYRIAYFLGYGSQNLIITQSELMKKQLFENLPKSKYWKIRSMSNPINLDLLLEKARQDVLHDENYIVAAGRLIDEKGFDILIEAYNNIKNEIGSIKLLILGEGKERKKLEDLIDRFNLEAKVKLLGFKENPMPYFKYADLCVVSSRVEGFPNVLLQMMTLNGNVVSTLCAGGIDEIEGIQTCEADNIETLANTMLEAIKNKIDNSKLFQQELETRRIEKYWNQIEAYLDES
jgi:glycosyltransferase involved in cell wall biosynthesis